MVAQREIEAGERFPFGENWRQFLERLDEDRIGRAVESLTLHLGDITGRTFLDIGAGSGLFSLAARRLGAVVTSFDYDPDAVACTEQLRARFFPGDAQWTIGQGSALDVSFIRDLGRFDIVYSWGVLHHTGDMWAALDNAASAVAAGGQLFVAIYNDQADLSRFWRRVKLSYNRSGRARRQLIAGTFGALSLMRRGIVSAKGYRVNRGMDWWRDVVDWVGGYPYEVATPGAVFAFLQQRGFVLTNLETVIGHGCNQYVFSKKTSGRG